MMSFNKGNSCIFNNSSDLFDGPNTAFDSKLGYDPKMLWKNGELSIMNLLSNNWLVAKKLTIKYDIIEIFLLENEIITMKEEVYQETLISFFLNFDAFFLSWRRRKCC